MIIYAINYGFGVFGLEMVMDFGSTKGNRCLVTATHCSFRDYLKQSRFAWLDRNWSMCVSSKILFELDGLNCVERNC